MGYFSLDIKKAKGTSDTTQSDHIERKIIPKNADPTRTHLNRVLVEWKIQCKLPPKTKRFCPLVLK